VFKKHLAFGNGSRQLCGYSKTKEQQKMMFFEIKTTKSHFRGRQPDNTGL